MAAALLFVACSSWRAAKSGVSADKPSAETRPADIYADTMPRDASFYYFEGVRAANIYENPDSALVNFRKVLELDSTHAPTYYEMASIEVADNPVLALSHSVRANELDQSNIWYKTQLGRMLIVNRKYDQAIGIYRDIIRLAPNRPENYRYLAGLYDQTGQPYTAISVLDSAEMKFGLMEEFSSYRRQLLINTRQADRAIEETRMLAANFPYDERNYVILGDLYASKRADSLAEEAYNEAFAIDSNSLAVIASMAEYYRSRDNISEFLKSVRRLLESEQIELDDKIDMFNDLTGNIGFYREYYFSMNSLVSTLYTEYPGDYKVQKLYATHLARGGNYEEMLRVYKNSLTDSVRMDAINAIIDVESYLKHPDSVDLYYDIALEHFPKNPDIYIRKGYALFSMKNYREAEKTMRSALKYAVSDSLRSIVYSTIGDIRHQKDSLRTSRYYPFYEKAIKLYPDNILALNNYSYFLSLEGKNLDKALEMIKRVMELDPGNPTYIDTYGWVLYKMGRYQEAKDVMRRAVTLDTSSSAELLAHYGDELHALGDNFLATVYWNKALENGYDRDEIEKRLKSVEGK